MKRKADKTLQVVRQETPAPIQKKETVKTTPQIATLGKRKRMISQQKKQEEVKKIEP